MFQGGNCVMAKKTRLYDRHVALGGRMIEFAGWILPVQYPTGPKAEHHRVREAAGLFDIDHMGQVIVSGPDALPFVQHVMTADVSAIPLHAAGYSLLCYADGTVVDDTFIYHLPDCYFVAINASNNRKDTRWLEAHVGGYDVRIENVSDGIYMLALQGPRAAEILAPLCAAPLDAMAYHTMVETTVKGVPTRLGRTGYTGEDGFELFFPANRAGAVWDALMAAGQPLGMLPIGLAARDSLRFEPCLPLYGQEISASISPLEAGLAWAVSYDKGDFIGRDALLKVRLEGPTRRLVAFEMVDRGVPRHEYVVMADGAVIGTVTSGMYAPTVDKFVGLALVDAKYSAIGASLGIVIRGETRAARVVEKPFYVPSYRR
ncbi:MAG: glycine cleavage system aminomethyltransferase GcvT [Chloroflexota bacterium]